jgi:hypothetical protein
MKVQNMIRVQVLTVGFTAALFFASAAPAQEITNTEWPDQATATMQSAPTQAANQASDSANTASASATEMDVPATPEAKVTPAESNWLAGLSLICAAAIAGLVVLTGSKRDEDVRARYDVRSVPHS